MAAENLLRNRLHLLYIFFFKGKWRPHANVCLLEFEPFCFRPSVWRHDFPSVAFQARIFQWLMEMFSHLRYYICFSSTTPLLPSDLHPDDIPGRPASSQPCDERDGLIYIIWAALGLRERKGSRKSSGTLDTHLKSNILSFFSKVVKGCWLKLEYHRRAMQTIGNKSVWKKNNLKFDRTVFHGHLEQSWCFCFLVISLAHATAVVFCSLKHWAEGAKKLESVLFLLLFTSKKLLNCNLTHYACSLLFELKMQIQ